MAQQFRNIAYLSDVSGTGVWRHIFQMIQANCVAQSLGLYNTFTQTPILDQNFYHGMTSVTCQRWINDQQRDVFCKFLRPVCDANQAWLIYGIDDAMHYRDIPLYNRGRAAFASDKVQDNIKAMLNTADFVVVTTDHIKQYYHDTYGVPLENIIAVPNLLPRWWFGDRYDPDKKCNEFSANRRKPRIGIVSSLSHFNVDNVREDRNGKAVKLQQKPDGTKAWINQDGNEVNENEIMKITDDFDDIASCIRDTVNDFQWVCFGYCPPQIKDLADKKLVEVHGGVPILDYASKLENLHLQAIVAPIKRMTFNLCKSFIKTMECAAIGVPLFATDCTPYSRVMKPEQLFSTAEDLKQKLTKFKFSSNGAYKKMIEEQWRWLNSPCKEGDFNLKNFWLEDNLNIWIDMFRLKQNTLRVSLQKFIQNFEAKKAEEQKNTIAKSKTGKAIILK